MVVYHEPRILHRAQTENPAVGIDEAHAGSTPLPTPHLQRVKPRELGAPIVVLEPLHGLGLRQGPQIVGTQVWVLDPTGQDAVSVENGREPLIPGRRPESDHTARR